MQPSFSRPVEQNHGIKMKKTCTKEHQVLGKGGNMPCQLSLFLGSSHVIPYIFGWLFVNIHFDILFPFQWMNLIYVKTFWVQQKLISIETLNKANTGFASIFLTQDCSGKHTLFNLHKYKPACLVKKWSLWNSQNNCNCCSPTSFEWTVKQWLWQEYSLQENSFKSSIK